MALQVGSRLGHYNVTAKIGEGGMGEVCRARDTKLNRQVALKIVGALFVVLFLTPGCSPGPATEPLDPSLSRSAEQGKAGVASASPNPLRNAYFGDLHIHTGYSFDAFLMFATKTTPDDAYRFAKGEAIDHALGFPIQLKSGPLDFYAVTDHAGSLGLSTAMTDSRSAVAKLESTQTLLRAATVDERRAMFRGYRELRNQRPEDEPVIRDPEIERSAWGKTVEAAERHYDPGTFTTFAGLEYGFSIDSQGLHRNVIFRDEAPDAPFRVGSRNPEALWAWMDQERAAGRELLAIPHNMNVSNGLMFASRTFEGLPLDAEYAALRMRNEPLVEIAQVKGASETHPLNSPNDEWADFEIFPYLLGTDRVGAVPGSYVREALLNGLVMEETRGFNPYRFGFIAASDGHNSAGTVEEDNYHGKAGMMDGLPVLRSSVPLAEPGPNGETYTDWYYDMWGAAGLTGAWAESNTRESIFDALRRKETFGTSGPRIRVRFFAGYGYDDNLVAASDMIEQAYAGGVPMGGDLVADDERAPRFLAWAVRDPDSAPLQRLQIVKGWVEDGAAHEQVFDIACSDGGDVDRATHRCPDNGATVDLSDCTIPAGVGAGELKRIWADPTFVAGQRALYYIRAIENPTCRWSTWDALRAGVEPTTKVAPTLQERAWSSPIWYVPH